MFFFSKNKPNAKELSACGRVAASEYVESHNVILQTFVFQRISMEITAKFKDGVFYFVKDGNNVILNQAERFNVRKGKRYLVEVNLSSYGDYDLREVNLKFDCETYALSAHLIR